MGIKPLDFVKTPGGAIALVIEVSQPDWFHIAYLGGGNPTDEKNALWTPEEGLVVIDSLPHLLSNLLAHPFGRNRKQGDTWFPL